MTLSTGTRHDIRTTVPAGVQESAGWVEGVLVLLRRWVALTLGLALGLALAAAYLATRDTTYTATSQVSVRNVIENPFEAGQNLTTSVSMPTERGIALSTSTAESVQATTGTSLTTKQLLSGVTVQNPPNSLILTFTYTSADAGQAVRLTNAFARSYLAVRRASVDASIATTTKSLENHVTVLQARMANFTKQLKTSTGTDRTVLLLEQSGVSAQLTTVQSQLDALAATDTSPGSVIERASSAADGDASSALVTVLGLLGGLVLGIAFCRFREATDRRVRSAAVVEATVGAPVLNDRALRFRSSSWRRDSAEVYRSMAVLLVHRLSEHGVIDAQKVVVLSARAGEGRTTLTARLATALTETGRRVLAVSADFVEPQLAQRLGGSDELGVVQALRQCASARPAPNGGRPSAVLATVQDVAGAANLRLLGSGIAGTQRSEVVPQLAAVPRLINHVLGCDEIAVVDTAPVFEVADTVALVNGMDAAVAVCVLGRTTKTDLRRLSETAASIGVPIVGVVVFRPDSKPASWLASAPASGSTTAALPVAVELPARSDEPTAATIETAAVEKPAVETPVVETAILETAATETAATETTSIEPAETEWAADRAAGGLTDVGLADVDSHEEAPDPAASQVDPPTAESGDEQLVAESFDDEQPVAESSEEADSSEGDQAVAESSEEQPPTESSDEDVPVSESSDEDVSVLESAEDEPAVAGSEAQPSLDGSAEDVPVATAAADAQPVGSQPGYVVVRNRIRTRNRARARKQPMGTRVGMNGSTGDSNRVSDDEPATDNADERVEVGS